MASEALAVFDEILRQDPDSVAAAVGEAISRWPAGTTARLRTLASTNPESGLARLHLGFALFWERRDAAALRAWREVGALEPDTPWALRAENLLHPDMPRGRPIFVPSQELPESLLAQPLAVQLWELEARARDEGSSQDWIAYGVTLQRAGRSISARDAFEQAALVAPDDPQARTAAAIGRFEKDDPAAAFAILGPLSAQFPDAPVVTYYLALLLLWIGELANARTQLEEAQAATAGAFLRRAGPAPPRRARPRDSGQRVASPEPADRVFPKPARLLLPFFVTGTAGARFLRRVGGRDAGTPGGGEVVRAPGRELAARARPACRPADAGRDRGCA